MENPLKASTVKISKDDIPLTDGNNTGERVPSTLNNQLLPPHMVQQSKALGLKEFRVEDLQGNPEYVAKFQNGN